MTPMKSQALDIAIAATLAVLVLGTIVLSVLHLVQPDVDIWQQVLTCLQLVLFLVIAGFATLQLRNNWHKLEKGFRILMIAMITTLLLAFPVSVYIDWPHLPWGRASAFQVADEFLADLKAADYTAAREKLTPVTQRSLSANALGGSSAQPITWQLGRMDRYDVITGTAVFADGIELPIQLRMDWLHGRWQIYGVTFGDRSGDLRLDFMVCCDD
jgi:hypothetical protein